MDIKFLARCKVSNHASRLERGEIFIVERTNESYSGKTVQGHSLVGVFNENNFDKIELSDGVFAVSIKEYESNEPGHLTFMKNTLLSLENEPNLNEDWLKGYVTLDSGKKLGISGIFPTDVVTLLPRFDNIQSKVGIVVEKINPEMKGEIALDKGECIRIISDNGMWYTVENSNGNTGTCPKKFIKIVDNNSSFKETEATMEPYCIALYDFSGEYDTELSFATDDVIKLYRWVDHEWLEGENQRTGATGYIPVTFVQIIVPPRELEVENTGDSVNIETMKTEELTTIGIATVLYAFEARYNDELTVEAGSSIKVLGIQGDWVNCWNPDTDLTGIVPRSFLRIFSDYDDTSLCSSKATNSRVSTISDNDDSKSIFVDRPWETFGNEQSITYSQSAYSVNNIESQEKKEPPARPPPPKIPFPALSTGSDNEAQHRAKKSQSIVQRTAPSRPKSMTKIYSTSICQPVTDRTSEGWESRRTKVLDEIIQSETSYLYDITAWETAVETNPNLSETRKKQILNGYPMLKYLSRELMSSLVIEQTKPVGEQEIGLKFMLLKEVFYKTYGQYFKSAEQVSEILIKGDENIRKALQDSLEDMRKNGSYVFDVPTALSRPIQRCLKYPLYLSEIVKNTPLTHCDHPKLMESLKQMGQLATKMNESKRRKEMAKKYSRTAVEQRDSGILNKLSKINLHTLVKKSSRLQYRITTRIGFISTYRDEDFDHMLKTLEEVQQRFCHLIYQMTVYKNRIVRLAKKYVEANTIVKLSPGQDLTLKFEHNNLLKRLLVYANELNNEVVELCCTAQELAKRDFTFIVHKRYDKLADWEMAVRSKKSQEVIDVRKCEFEALNSQLKLIFPKEIDKLIDGLKKYVKRIKQIDHAFFKRVRKWLHEFKLTAPPDFRQYVDFKNLRLRQIENTLRTNNAYIATKIQQCIPEPLQQVTFDSPIDQPPLVYDHPIFGRSQTKTEREKLIKLCRALGFHDSLCKVTADYISSDKKFVLKKGDVIRERSVSNGLSLVENGLATYTVPSTYYKKVKHPFSTSLAETSDSGGASDSENEVNLKNIQKFLNQQEKARLSNESPKSELKSESQQKFCIPDAIIKKVESQNPNVSSSNGRASVNWLQYDDKIIDLPSVEEVSRPAPAPPESLLSWTTFDDDNTIQQSIIPPEKIFGNLHNPQPMEPIRLSVNDLSITPTDDQITWRAASPVTPKYQYLPTNPFVVNNCNRNTIATSNYISQNISQNSRKSEPDILATLITEEISKTKNLSQEKRSVSSNIPKFPKPPTLPPPQPPKDEKPPLPVRDYREEKSNEDIIISKYDFSPVNDDGIQLKMKEGEILKIIRKYDDANNTEWWLVKNNNGKTGYVPATYLIPKTNCT